MEKCTEKRLKNKTCFVPGCSNTTENAPNKMFLAVPSGSVRKAWFTAVNIRILHTGRSTYCCEDHFDIPDDVENYIRLKLMGEGKVRMKKGVVPHKNLPRPISLREELNSRETALQSQKKGIKQTNVENSETVDGCQTNREFKRSAPVTGKKQKRFKKIDDDKQMQSLDCTNYFIEKEGKVRIPRSNLYRNQPVISGYKTVSLQNSTEINGPVFALNSVECNVQNVSDNKVILEISDPNNILSNLHGLTDQYSAVIEQVIDKNDVKTHIVLCKKEQMNNETNAGKSQETDDSETVLPDIGQENIENECKMESETDICDVKIKMEESETDVMNIKLEAEYEEAFLPHIKQEVDGCPFERGVDVNEKGMKNDESRETDTIQIKVEAKEESDGPCLSHVKQEFTECVWIPKTTL